MNLAPALLFLLLLLFRPIIQDGTRFLASYDRGI
jgi:hypothetical protein